MTKEPSSFIGQPISKHRIATRQRSRLPSVQSRQNLLDRNQQNTTRKDSTKQRKRGNVAQRNTNRPQQTKIHCNGTETHRAGPSRAWTQQREQTQHLPSTANRHRIKRQNKARANREQLIVDEVDTHQQSRGAPASRASRTSQQASRQGAACTSHGGA